MKNKKRVICLALSIVLCLGVCTSYAWTHFFSFGPVSIGSGRTHTTAAFNAPGNYTLQLTQEFEGFGYKQTMLTVKKANASGDYVTVKSQKLEGNATFKIAISNGKGKYKVAVRCDSGVSPVTVSGSAMN